jgi:F-type H+-transporting ATPase subunit delta
MSTPTVISPISKRYAKAIFDLAVENRNQDRVLADLRSLNSAFALDPSIADFFSSPMVTPAKKTDALKKALAGKDVSTEVNNFMLLLAEKDRLAVFSDAVEAFQTEIDDANNVCRGVVRSMTALSPAERTQVEETVEGILKKKVIMSYKVDPSVIGGLVAQVGSHTFDDSLQTHMMRMTEELKRKN